MLLFLTCARHFNQKMYKKKNELKAFFGYAPSTKDQSAVWLSEVEAFLSNCDQGKLIFLHVGLTTLVWVLLAAMPVNVFELLLLKILFLLCACSHAEFGYFQVQRSCRYHPVLVPQNCDFSCLLSDIPWMHLDT